MNKTAQNLLTLANKFDRKLAQQSRQNQSKTDPNWLQNLVEVNNGKYVENKSQPLHKSPSASGDSISQSLFTNVDELYKIVKDVLTSPMHAGAVTNGLTQVESDRLVESLKTNMPYIQQIVNALNRDLTSK